MIIHMMARLLSLPSLVHLTHRCTLHQCLHVTWHLNGAGICDQGSKFISTTWRSFTTIFRASLCQGSQAEHWDRGTLSSNHWECQSSCSQAQLAISIQAGASSMTEGHTGRTADLAKGEQVVCSMPKAEVAPHQWDPVGDAFQSIEVRWQASTPQWYSGSQYNLTSSWQFKRKHAH